MAGACCWTTWQREWVRHNKFSNTNLQFPLHSSIEYTTEPVWLFENGQPGIVRSNYSRRRDSINKHSATHSIPWPKWEWCQRQSHWCWQQCTEVSFVNTRIYIIYVLIHGNIDSSHLNSSEPHHYWSHCIAKCVLHMSNVGDIDICISVVDQVRCGLRNSN